MKKSKYFLVIGIIALCSLSFLPIALAAEKRSLDDWFFPVLSIYYPNHGVVGLANPDIGIYMQRDYDLGGIPIWKSDYTGYVLDRLMKNGDHFITVKIHVKNAPCVVTDYNDLFFKGYIDYKYEFKFIIHTSIWIDRCLFHGFDDDGYTDEGNVVLPPWFFVGEEYLGLEHVKTSFVGSGLGEILLPYGDFLPGDTAKVTLTQIGITNPGHEYVWPAGFWPAEVLKIH